MLSHRGPNVEGLLDVPSPHATVMDEILRCAQNDGSLAIAAGRCGREPSTIVILSCYHSGATRASTNVGFGPPTLLR
jgi:hypothetical protein